MGYAIAYRVLGGRKMPTKRNAKSVNPKRKKRSKKPAQKRNVMLKSASWYSGAMQAVGISNVVREER
jgi:hypothetical protein